MIKVIGIDPGFELTGFGIVGFDGRSITHVKHGTIKTCKSNTEGERLEYIRACIRRLLHDHGPEYSAVERFMLPPNMKGQNTQVMNWVVGVCKAALYDTHCRMYYPTQMKKYVTSNGKAEKHEIERSVKSILNIKKLQSVHAADALGHAITRLSDCSEYQLNPEIHMPLFRGY